MKLLINFQLKPQGWSEIIDVKDASNKDQKANETTLWLGYPVTKDLKANLGYTVVDETNAATHGDYNQVNLTLTYSF